jgi:hypothetical protein
MSIDPAPPGPPRCAWVVYYVGPRITVTSWYVQTADGRRYEAQDLGMVVRVLTFAHPGRTTALFAGGVEMLVALPFAVVLQSAVMCLAGVLAAVGIAGGVLADAHRNPRWMQLRASYRDTNVVLFSGRDLGEFERVRWALIRALEANRAPQP